MLGGSFNGKHGSATPEYSVTYYDKGQYVQIEGKVSKLNLDTKMIQIVKTKLDLKKIIDISI